MGDLLRRQPVVQDLFQAQLGQSFQEHAEVSDSRQR